MYVTISEYQFNDYMKEIKEYCDENDCDYKEVHKTSGKTLTQTEIILDNKYLLIREYNSYSKKFNLYKNNMWL